MDWKRAAFGFALPKLPAVVGLDCCGVVEEVGEGVTKFKKGDVVFAWAPTDPEEGFGCWAEYGLFDETHLTLKPDTWTEDETPCLGVTGLTALQGLFHESALGLNLPSKPISDEQFVLVRTASKVSPIFACLHPCAHPRECIPCLNRFGVPPLVSAKLPLSLLPRLATR